MCVRMGVHAVCSVGLLTVCDVCCCVRTVCTRRTLAWASCCQQTRPCSGAQHWDTQNQPAYCERPPPPPPPRHASLLQMYSDIFLRFFACLIKVQGKAHSNLHPIMDSVRTVKLSQRLLNKATPVNCDRLVEEFAQAANPRGAGLVAACVWQWLIFSR